MSITFLRKPAAMSALGLKATSTFYLRITQGLLPPPVRLGARSVAWPQHEVDAVNRARLAGRSDDDLRALVTRLVEARATAGQEAA